MKNYILLFILSVVFISCNVQRASKLTSDKLRPGMSKSEVIAACGKPYKEGFDYLENKTLLERLYYKEVIFANKWVEITTILHFEDAKLVSVEQGREKPVSDKELGIN